MKKQIARFSPHQNGKVFAILMAVSSLVFVIPMVLVFSFVSPPVNQQGQPVGPPTFLFILFPFMYLIFGYVFVAVGCAIYNFLYKYIGGIELEVQEKNDA